MKVGYTEFSYGYAFTENLVRGLKSGPKGAPVFPNLVEEAKLGYDVKIDLPIVPLFFQFKLPELMKRASASEIAGGKCPGLSLPFYRIAMMRRDVSDQHKHLIDWEAKFPGCVWYAAPCLPHFTAFNTAYASASVFSTSAFFSPTDIGPLPDNKQHSVAYRPGMGHAYFCSNPKDIVCSTFQDVSLKAAKHFDDKRFADAEAAARNIKEDVMQLASRAWQNRAPGVEDRIRARNIGPTTGSSKEQDSRRQIVTDLLVARETARIDLGVDMAVAQPA